MTGPVRDATRNQNRNEYNFNNFSLSLGISCAVFGGFGASIYMYLSKLLNNMDYHYSWITFWSSLIQSAYSFLFMICFEEIVISLSLYEIFLVLGHSILIGIGLVSHYVAICEGEINFVCIVFNAEIPMKVIVQFLIFPDMQIVQTNWLDIVGAMLVIIATILLPLHEILKNKLTMFKKEEDYGLIEETSE